MKYAGLDVHDKTVAVRIIDASGAPLHQAVIPTERASIRQSLKAVRGPVSVAFEAGPLAGWLSEVLSDRVASITICATRRRDLHGNGSRTDGSDALRIAEALRIGALRPVFHGDRPSEELRVFAHHYRAVTQDAVRVKVRLRALFRSRAIDTGGAEFYARDRRRAMLRKLAKRPAEYLRAKALFMELDLIVALQREAREALVARAEKSPIFAILCTFPCVGPVRAALFMAIVITPERFRNRRRFWRYGGLAVRRRATGEHAIADGSVQRVPNKGRTWGLDRQCNHELKRLLRETACGGISSRHTVLRRLYDRAIERGLPSPVARTLLARKIAATLLSLWRSMRPFDPKIFAAH